MMRKLRIFVLFLILMSFLCLYLAMYYGVPKILWEISGFLLCVNLR